ncbi:MAG: STAS domain-containing protein [Phycisphaerae bacterium]|nr:STAS domain-containing protein [Phycisphaerae bacterium]
MRWIVDWHENHTVLRFEGDLMIGATQFFETGVLPWLAVPFAPIILDLSDLKIIVSAGLASLIKIQNAASSADVHVVLVRPAEEAWQALKLTRLDRLFPHAESVKEAVTLVKGKSS